SVSTCGLGVNRGSSEFRRGPLAGPSTPTGRYYLTRRSAITPSGKGEPVTSPLAGRPGGDEPVTPANTSPLAGRPGGDEPVTPANTSPLAGRPGGDAASTSATSAPASSSSRPA